MQRGRCERVEEREFSCGVICGNIIVGASYITSYKGGRVVLGVLRSEICAKVLFNMGVE